MPRFELHKLPPEPQGDWMFITLKYGGRCLGCYEWVEEGEVRRRLCASCFQSVPETQMNEVGLCTGCQ